MVKHAIMAAVFLAGGFALSSWWTTRGNHAALPAVEASREQMGPSAPPPSASDQAAMRTMIRQELQQALGQGGARAGGAQATDDAAAEDRNTIADDPSAPVRTRGRQAAPTPAQVAARAAATTLVDASLAVGRWTEQNETEWQELEDQLAPGAAQDVRGHLFEAINEGRLVAEPRFGRRAGMPQPVAVRTP